MTIFVAIEKREERLTQSKKKVKKSNGEEEKVKEKNSFSGWGKRKGSCRTVRQTDKQ